VKVAGYILFFIGMIPGFIFAAKIPVSWIYFIISSAVAATGAVLIRLSGKKRKGQGAEEKRKDTSLNSSELFEIVRKIDETLKSMVSSIEGADRDDLKSGIESIQESMLEFIDNRHVLSDEYDFKSASEIFIIFAGGERYVNRAWSSLVDGYMEEAGKSLKIASRKFSETLELCNKPA